MVKLSDETVFQVLDLLLAAIPRLLNEKSPGAGTPGPEINHKSNSIKS